MSWWERMALKLMYGLSFGVSFGMMELISALVTSIIVAIPIFFLWNWLMPALFSIKSVTFWQAWGIGFLTRTFFSGVPLLRLSSKNKS